MTDVGPREPAEEWREIPGHNGAYEISNLGNVRSWKPWRGSTTALPRPLKVVASARGGLVQLGLHGGTWRIELLMAHVWGAEMPAEPLGVSQKWRRVMLSERQHFLLCQVLEASADPRFRGDPASKLLSCVRAAKVVDWHDPIDAGEFA